MKFFLKLLIFTGVFIFTSCSSEPSSKVDNDTISEVFEVKNVSFTSSNSFSTFVDLNPSIYSSDVILVYRLSGNDQGKNVWKLIPESYYFNDGTFDFGYNFDFTQDDIKIYMNGKNLGTVANSFRFNQVFRIVIVPGSSSQNLNKNNLEDVLNALNKDENSIQKINF